MEKEQSNVPEYKCMFCNKIYKNKYSLKTHINTAKNCLKLRGETADKYSCEYCDFQTSRTHVLTKHIATCKSYIKIKKEMEENKKTTLKAFEEYKKEIESKIHKEYNDKLINQLSKPSINNTQNNNLTLNAKLEFLQSKIQPFHELIPHIEPIINRKFTEKHLLGGPASCAAFIHEEILTKPDGTTYYASVENDKHFYYKDQKDNLQIDNTGKMVKNYIVPKLVNKSQEVYINKRNELTEFGNNLDTPLVKPYQTANNKIKGLQHDSSKLINNLSKECNISKEQIKMKLKNVPDDEYDQESEDEIEHQPVKPYSYEKIEEMQAKIKLMDQDTKKNMLLKLEVLCDFILEHIDYKYDVYKLKFILPIYNEDNELIYEEDDYPNSFYSFFDNLKRSFPGQLKKDILTENPNIWWGKMHNIEEQIINQIKYNLSK